MPKIVIKEYDKTSAGIGLYSNFTVLVPGFVDEEVYDKTNFDDDGVCEVASKEDFIKYIGKRSAQSGIVEEAIPAQRDPGAPISFTEEDSNSDSDSDSDERTPKERLLDYLENALPPGKMLCEWKVNKSGKIGYLKDLENEYTIITSDVVSDPNYVVKDTGYYTIINDKMHLGSDSVLGTQYGNQIAYELLKLGYTILFKKLTTIDDLTKNEFWAPMKDKSLYDFRYVIHGLLSGTKEANNKIRDLVHFVNLNASTAEDNGRGDCTALCEIDADKYAGKSQAEALDGIEEAAAEFTASKYAALFAPWVTYKDIEEDGKYNNNKQFPAVFHYLACAARAAENYREWYAVAGYTRGVSNFNIEAVGCKFGEEAVNALEPRWVDKVDKAVNIIVKVKNNYYLWGNRTAEALGEAGSEDGNLKASHFLNIRQLCSTIKKQVYVTCRRYTFDPNSDVLWINFCSAIRPLLEKMKADQGITDYKFVKIKTKEKGILKAKIRIVPIEAVEDFDISLTLEDSITGTESVIDEGAE